MLRIIWIVCIALSLSAQSALAFTLEGRTAGGLPCSLKVGKMGHEEGSRRFFAEVEASFLPGKLYRVVGNPRLPEMSSLNENGLPDRQLTISLRFPASGGPKALFTAKSYRFLNRNGWEKPVYGFCQGLRPLRQPR